ncbi:MAG: SURF1 family protein [Ilumatobacteraceae bacterium]
MPRFLVSPRWIAFHLLVVVGVVAMVNLGFWQLRRLDERRAFNAVVEASYDSTPVSFGQLVDRDWRADADGLGAVDDSGIAWRLVTVSGTYDESASLRVVNRSQYGRAGDNLVAPLHLDDGRVVLVNRGFVPLGVDDPPLPGTEVEVLGRLRPSEERSAVGARDPSDGLLTEVQRLDLVRLSRQFTGLAPVYLELVSSSPAEADGLPQPVVRPDLSEGSHLSYAVQWFIFAGAAVVGWVLAVRLSIRRRANQPD